MRKALLAVLFLIPVLFSIVPDLGAGAYGASAPGISNSRVRIDISGVHLINPQDICPSCSIFTTQPFMAPSINEDEKTVSVSMGVINESGVTAVEGATIFTYVKKPDGSNAQIPCRVYTNANGSAKISYNPVDCQDGCTVKFFFCCANPVALACVLEPCLGEPVTAYTDVPACTGYGGGDWPANATVEGQEIQLYPTLEEAAIPPRAVLPGFEYTFTLCFPLLMIFGFLGAAMYASGRDPFAMFSFYTPRFTRGMERPIQGRGYTIPGSSIINVAMKATDLGTGKTSANEMFVSSMEQSPMVAKTKGAAGELGGAKSTAGARPVAAGASQEELTSRTSADRMVAGGSGAVIGQSIGVSESMMRPGEAGVGVGTALLALLGIMLRFSNAPWLTGGLSQRLIGIADAWQAERVSGYFQTNAAPIAGSMHVRFDSEGNVSQLTYVSPQTGETVTVEGVDKCRAFVDSVRNGLAANAQAGDNNAIDGLNQFNERVANLQHPVTGARAMLIAEGSREGGPTGEVLAAMATLADPSSSPDKRRQALETIANSDQVSGDVKIAAFVAASDGMNYQQFAAFVGAEGSSAARIFGELTSNSAALNERLDGKIDGNMLGAIGAAAERLEQLNAGRREGQADSLGIGTIVANMRSDMGECRGGPEVFVFRSGTEDSAARMAAMGLSGAALDMRISLDALGQRTAENGEVTDGIGQRLILGHLSDDARAEVEAAMDSEGRVDISKLSGNARGELGSVIEQQVRGAIVSEYNVAYSQQQATDFKNGNSGEALTLRDFQEALGNYTAATQSSYEIMNAQVMGPAREEALALIERNPNPVDNLGRLTTMVLPEQLAANDVRAVMERRGIDPELASIMVGIAGAQTQRDFINGRYEERPDGQREYVPGLSERLGLLAMGPTESYGQRADNAYASLAEIDRQVAEFNGAIQTLDNPNASPEEKEHARGVVAGGMEPFLEYKRAEASQILENPEASQADKEWATRIMALDPATAFTDEGQRGTLWQEYNAHMGEQKDQQRAEMEFGRTRESIFASGPPLGQPSNEQERIAAQEREAALRQAVEQYTTSAYSQAETKPDSGQIIQFTIYGDPNAREMLDAARPNLPATVQAQLDTFLSNTASQEEKSRALDVLVPALDNYYRYAENSADDRLTAADRSEAQWAVHTLTTSEDSSARQQAAESLRELRGVSGEAQPGIDALIATATVPPSQWTDEQRANLGAVLPKVQERLDIYFDTTGYDRAISNPDGTRQGLINDYANDRQSELNATRDWAQQAGTTAARTEYETAQIQVSLLGNEAIDRFYQNMDANREIAERAARNVTERGSESVGAEIAGRGGWSSEYQAADSAFAARRAEEERRRREQGGSEGGQR